MKIIAIYTIALLLTFDVFAFQSEEKSWINGQEIANLDYSADLSPNSQMTSSSQTTLSVDLDKQAQPVRRQDGLLTEISIYALIVLVYSLYWMKVS
jgi:hypothetical protein